MSSGQEPNLRAIGTSAGSPLDPNRVGELPKCIDTIRRVRKLAQGHIDSLTELQQKDVRTIFANTTLLEDPNSQWHGFTPSRIGKRLEWFTNDLIPVIEHNLKKMENLLHAFSEFWDMETRARISDTGKGYIEGMHKIWRAIQVSLAMPSAGPYRVEVITECKSLLKRLEEEIESMRYTLEAAWRNSTDVEIFVDRWFEEGFSEWTLELPTDKLIPSQESPLNSRSPILLGDSHDWDAERGSPRSNIGGQNRHSLLKKELFLVAACLIIALVYSIVKKDVQTGFTIAGVVLTCGNVILAAVTFGKGPKKLALE